MEKDDNVELKALTPEEYSKRTDEFYTAGDIDRLLEFQRIHTILYIDPIPEQDKEILKDIEISNLPENFDVESLQDNKQD